MNAKRKSGRIYTILIAIFALLFVSSAVGFFLSYYSYQKGEKFYQELSQARTEQSGSALPTVDFDALKTINRSIVAWIYQEGTGINYPVVQGEDNDYYLNHLLNGDKNKYGTPFVDYRTVDPFKTAITIVYGHNMKNGAVFASLVEYENQSYYEEHPTISLMTPEGNYTLEIFSGFVTDGNSDFYQREFQSDNDFLQYVANVSANSDFQCDVTVSATDSIVMLSTCAYDFDEARYVLFAKIVKDQ